MAKKCSGKGRGQEHVRIDLGAIFAASRPKPKAKLKYPPTRNPTPRPKKEK
jgi:hypothetical protein